MNKAFIQFERRAFQAAEVRNVSKAGSQFPIDPLVAETVVETYPTVEASRLAAGRMFWLMRKKLSGSYFALTAASRS